MVYIIRHGWLHEKWSREIDCRRCDAKFLIKKSDLREEYGLQVINCPECTYKEYITLPDIARESNHNADS